MQQVGYRRHVIVRGVPFTARMETRALGRIEVEEHTGRRVWVAPWRRDRIYQAAKAPADTRHLGDGVCIDLGLLRVLDEFGVESVELVFASPAVTLTGPLDLWRISRRNGRIVATSWGSQAHVALSDLDGGVVVARMLDAPRAKAMSFLPDSGDVR